MPSFLASTRHQDALAKVDLIQFEGHRSECLPLARFSRRVSRWPISGDPYDLTKCQINYRHKMERRLAVASIL